MNPLQMALQIKHELETVSWADGSAELVFGAKGSVLVYAGTSPSEEDLPKAYPVALVTIGSGVPDEDDPELIEQTFDIVVIAESAGDSLGEFAIIGGQRADLGKSAGAGVAEVTERVRFAVQKLTGADGAKVLLSGSGIGAAAALGRGKHIALAEYTVTGFCTSQPVFAAPQQLVHSSGTWTWQGTQCSERHDFVQFRLMWKTGTTPPATPADADGTAYTGTPATTTHTAGTGRAYAVFADYKARGTLSHSSEGDRKGAYLTT